MAVLHLVRQFYPPVLAVFCNTGVEYPQTLAFRDRILSEWADLHYCEVHPEHGDTFWTIAKEYGLPGVRLDGKNRVPKCCTKLKDDPAVTAYQDHRIELCFTGITAAESRNRWMLQRRCGEYYFAKTDNLWKCHPIMSWTEEEVYEYHKANSIPLNSLYTEFPGVRVGCMPCTSYKSWPETMAKTTPKLYRHIQKMRGQEMID
jgi:phosphoadenosine phosphosulfate reductase